MSFISILTKIGQVGSAVAGVEKTAGPLLDLIPGVAPWRAVVDGIVSRVQSAIVTVEANNPVSDGKLKSDATIADFQAGLALTQQILAAQGKTLVYDQAALQAAINAQVEAYNQFAKLKASFQTVDLPKPGAQPAPAGVTTK